MEFKKGDRVSFKPDLILGAGLQRRGQVGVVIAVHDLPGQAHLRVDIEFPDGGVVRGISVTQIEQVRASHFLAGLAVILPFFKESQLPSILLGLIHYQNRVAER